jgi:ADP-ribosyl-[dinitrogen reductase] hydrolase
MFGRKSFPPTPIPNSFWIVPGRILAGEYPGGWSEEETRLRLDAFVKAGVSAFLNLTRPGELAPYDAELPRKLPDGRRILHLNKPLDDHGLPQSRVQMEDILFELDRVLDQGDLVYVHCRAGIGRTNMVLGCWMRRHGMTGAAAIKRLNKLWKANARSATWPRIPEEHQEQYVLSWPAPGEKPVARNAAAPAPKITMQERYEGAVVGLACGDSMGTSALARIAGGFAPVTDLRDGEWGDDTSMMLCVAASLIECGGFDAGDLMRRLLDWQQTGALSSTGQAAGVTPAVSKALAAFKWSGNAFAGSHDPLRWDPEALSRVGAVALFAAAAPATVFAWVADAARVTHQSPGILDACRYYAALILAILRGSPKSSVLGDAALLLRHHYGKPLKAPLQRFADMTTFPTGEPTAKTEAVAGVLHRVLRVFAETSNFRDGLLRICSLAGPADVQGAVFGQLAGAFYGIDAIPTPWRETVLQGALLDATAERLFEAAATREE